LYLFLDIYMNIHGTALFVVIFVLIIPYIILKLGYTTFLEAYFPNLDIIATIISYHRGYGDTVFKDIYNPICSSNENKEEEESIFNVSEVFINYLSLMGLIFVVFIHSKGNMYHGLTRASVMLLITYLLPNEIVAIVLDRVQKNVNYNVILVLMIGFMLMGVILFIEYEILKIFAPYIEKIIKNIIYYGKHLDNKK